MASHTQTTKDAARKMWWALNSLIPCVVPNGNKDQIEMGTKAMQGWLEVDEDEPEDWP